MYTHVQFSYGNIEQSCKVARGMGAAGGPRLKRIRKEIMHKTGTAVAYSSVLSVKCLTHCV